MGDEARRLLAQLQTITPADVPSELQIPLAEQLRDLAHDLELQARYTVLPLSPYAPGIEGESSPNWETIDSDSLYSPPNRLPSDDPIGEQEYASATWESEEAAEIPLPSSPFDELRTPPSLPEDDPRRFFPFSDHSKNGPSRYGSDFDDSPLSLDVSTTFKNSPGSDRRMPLFAAKHSREIFRRSPIASPSHPESLVVAREGDASQLTPRSKQSYRDVSGHFLREGDNPNADMSSLSIESIPSGLHESAELSSSNGSGYVESHHAQLTPNNRSDLLEGEYSSEPSSFLSSHGKGELENPFWGQSPKQYPSLDDSNAGLAFYNEFSGPVNRSHKLHLALQAAKQDQDDTRPSQEHSEEIEPAGETENQLPRVSFAVPHPPPDMNDGRKSTAYGRPKAYSAKKPSRWGSVIGSVLQIVQRKDKSDQGQNMQHTTQDGMSNPVPKPRRSLQARKSLKNIFASEEDIGRTLRAKRSFRHLFHRDESSE